MSQKGLNTGNSNKPDKNSKLSFAISIGIFSILLFVFISSAFAYTQNIKRNKSHTEEMRVLMQRVYTEAEKSPSEEGVSDGLAKLHEQNPDLVGWLSIAEADFEYPVMQTRHNPDFYLTHDFEGNEDIYGVPYVDARCIIISPYANVLIHGHNMKDGKVFGILRSYENEAFFQQHRTIRFDTLNALGSYDVFAVFKTTVSEEGFAYYDYMGGSSEDAFNDYVNRCLESSLYETGITPVFGRQLLTLSTCDTYDDSQRIVLVAQKR